MIGRSEVDELADSIEFVVVNANNRRCLCVLSQDIRLIQTDGQTEVLTAHTVVYQTSVVYKGLRSK